MIRCPATHPGTSPEDSIAHILHICRGALPCSRQPIPPPAFAAPCTSGFLITTVSTPFAVLCISGFLLMTISTPFTALCTSDFLLTTVSTPFAAMCTPGFLLTTISTPFAALCTSGSLCPSLLRPAPLAAGACLNSSEIQLEKRVYYCTQLMTGF